MELHKELGFSGAERLYQAAARQLREADIAFRPTELRRQAKDVASKSKEKDLFHKQTYGGKVARLSEGTWQADVIDMTPQGVARRTGGYVLCLLLSIFSRERASSARSRIKRLKKFGGHSPHSEGEAAL